MQKNKITLDSTLKEEFSKIHQKFISRRTKKTTSLLAEGKEGSSVEMANKLTNVEKISTPPTNKTPSSAPKPVKNVKKRATHQIDQTTNLAPKLSVAKLRKKIRSKIDQIDSWVSTPSVVNVKKSATPQIEETTNWALTPPVANVNQREMPPIDQTSTQDPTPSVIVRSRSICSQTESPAQLESSVVSPTHSSSATSPIMSPWQGWPSPAPSTTQLINHVANVKKGVAPQIEETTNWARTPPVAYVNQREMPPIDQTSTRDTTPSVVNVKKRVTFQIEETTNLVPTPSITERPSPTGPTPPLVYQYPLFVPPPPDNESLVNAYLYGEDETNTIEKEADKSTPPKPQTSAHTLSEVTIQLMKILSDNKPREDEKHQEDYKQKEDGKKLQPEEHLEIIFEEAGEKASNKSVAEDDKSIITINYLKENEVTLLVTTDELNAVDDLKSKQEAGEKASNKSVAEDDKSIITINYLKENEETLLVTTDELNAVDDLKSKQDAGEKASNKSVAEDDKSIITIYNLKDKEESLLVTTDELNAVDDLKSKQDAGEKASNKSVAEDDKSIITINNLKEKEESLLVTTDELNAVDNLKSKQGDSETVLAVTEEKIIKEYIDLTQGSPKAIKKTIITEISANETPVTVKDHRIQSIIDLTTKSESITTKIDAGEKASNKSVAEDDKSIITINNLKEKEESLLVTTDELNAVDNLKSKQGGSETVLAVTEEKMIKEFIDLTQGSPKAIKKTIITEISANETPVTVEDHRIQSIVDLTTKSERITTKIDAGEKASNKSVAEDDKSIITINNLKEKEESLLVTTDELNAVDNLKSKQGGSETVLAVTEEKMIKEFIDLTQGSPKAIKKTIITEISVNETPVTVEDHRIQSIVDLTTKSESITTKINHNDEKAKKKCFGDLVKKTKDYRNETDIVSDLASAVTRTLVCNELGKLISEVAKYDYKRKEHKSRSRESSEEKSNKNCATCSKVTKSAEIVPNECCTSVSSKRDISPNSSRSNSSQAAVTHNKSVSDSQKSRSRFKTKTCDKKDNKFQESRRRHKYRSFSRSSSVESSKEKYSKSKKSHRRHKYRSFSRSSSVESSKEKYSKSKKSHRRHKYRSFSRSSSVESKKDKYSKSKKSHRRHKYRSHTHSRSSSEESSDSQKTHSPKKTTSKTRSASKSKPPSDRGTQKKEYCTDLVKKRKRTSTPDSSSSSSSSYDNSHSRKRRKSTSSSSRSPSPRPHQSKKRKPHIFEKSESSAVFQSVKMNNGDTSLSKQFTPTVVTVKSNPDLVIPGKTVKSTCDGKTVKSTCDGKTVKSTCDGKTVKSTCGGKTVKSTCGGKTVKSTCDGKTVKSTCDIKVYKGDENVTWNRPTGDMRHPFYILPETAELYRLKANHGAGPILVLNEICVKNNWISPMYMLLPCEFNKFKFSLVLNDHYFLSDKQWDTKKIAKTELVKRVLQWLNIMDSD